MNIRVDEVAPGVSDKYPYTHRVEIGDLEGYVKVLDWINANDISACVIGHSQAIYLNTQSTEWLLLRWS